MGSVLRDLTGHVNETRIRIYLRIYLFRGECRGRTSLAGEQQRGQDGAGERPVTPCGVAPGAPFAASSAGTASVCSYSVRLTRGEKKLTNSQIK